MANGADLHAHNPEYDADRDVGLLVLSGNLWCASALTLGVLVGYLSFSITHHAIHHWSADSAWLKQRKHCTTIAIEQSGCFGVTSAFWDYVFGSARGQRK